MKLLAAGIVLLLFASTGVEAGLFHKRDKLPKPIDHPIVRPKYQDAHKQGKRAGVHPSEFQKANWGAEWRRTLKLRPHEIPGYLYQTE